MSKLLEAITLVCWIAMVVNEFAGLWSDNTLVLATAVLAALLALLYEVRERLKPPS
jgi:FtsH-binding integral membrane protein